MPTASNVSVSICLRVTIVTCHTSLSRCVTTPDVTHRLVSHCWCWALFSDMMKLMFLLNFNLHTPVRAAAQSRDKRSKIFKYDKIWRHNWISFYLLKSAISRSNPQLLKYYFELTMTICIKFTLLCSSSLFTRLSCQYSRVPVTWSGCYSLLKKL